MITSIPARPARVAALAVIALVALVGAGCSKMPNVPLLPNQAPEVRLTAAPLVDDKLRPEFYSYTIQWVGFDPDGRVDHYLYAVDPESLIYSPQDTAWHATVKNEQTFSFSADTTIDDPLDLTDPRSRSFHVFAVYAVDNSGKTSVRPAARAFWSFTQAPTVSITDPNPGGGLNLTPSVRFSWTGSDPDGQFTTKPVRWAFRLFGKINPDFPFIPDFLTFAQLDPDSLRKLYMPGSQSGYGDFKGWNKVGADTTSFQYTALSASSEENPGYLFVVTGFDEAGAYDPIFEIGRNMLEFAVTFATNSGPLIRIFNQFFDYTYPYPNFDEQALVDLEVPADVSVILNWDAEPAPGADISRYRWGVDMVDLDDDSPRRVETDWTDKHWSAWGALVKQASVGPFHINGETHNFYIEAEDNNRLLSLGGVRIISVKADFPHAKDLLIVDDTRLQPDQRSPGEPYEPPLGPWPTAAELDTFLYAKGGYHWQTYPDNVKSPPGIFNGYEFDTLGTTRRSLDGLVPLSILVQYRHVIWMVDPVGATYTNGPLDQALPTTALRLCSAPSRPATLSTYIVQGLKTDTTTATRIVPGGGKVWLLGGGAAVATLAAYDNRNNGPSVYSRDRNELQEGRLMFDFAHWREEITILPGARADKFAPGSLASGQGNNRPGRGWPLPRFLPPEGPTPQHDPDYSILPLTLLSKDPSTDPGPPGRVDAMGHVDPNFYVSRYGAEYISKPSYVFEDYDPHEPEVLYSTLDTLYMAAGSSAQRDKPVMTYYHGLECQPFVFSGFNIWYWRRQDCIALVDFVVGSVWGLPRDASASRAMPASAPAPRNRQRASR